MKAMKAAALALGFCLGGAAFGGEGMHGGKQMGDMKQMGGMEQMAGMKKMKAMTQQHVQKHKGWLEKNVKDWPEKTQGVIATTIDKYGPPHEQTATMLVWHDVGPWRKTAIYKDEVEHRFPMPHKDVMEQWIAYDVPVEKFDDLAAYDGSVIAERTKGVLSARCDKEAANFLAINLANDVATGKKTVDEARQYYANAIAKMVKTGEQDRYMSGLQFKHKPMQATADPDRPAPEFRQGIGGAGTEGEDASGQQPDHGGRE